MSLREETASQPHVMPQLQSTILFGVYYMDTTRLFEIIKSHGIAFGSTAAGSAWCVKALHPAHVMGPIVGVPDRTCVPSALLEFKGNFTVPIPATTLPTYDVTLIAQPSVIMPCLYSTFGTAQTNAGVLNGQISGTLITDKVASWRTNVLEARLVYYGLTVVHDSPSLYDQGSVVMSQVNPSFLVKANVDPATATYSAAPITYDTLINLPASVQGQAKDGGYMPMRLSNPSLLYISQTNTYTYSGMLSGVFTATIPQLLDGQICCYAVRNISTQSQLRVIYRMGVEVCVPPGSAYSPFAQTMGIPDSAALDAYYSISSKMADGYPASYNDWDQLWSVIKNIGGTVLPIVKTMLKTTPIAPVIGGIEAIQRIVNKRRNARRQTATAIVQEAASKKQQLVPGPPGQLNIKRRAPATALPQRKGRRRRRAAMVDAPLPEEVVG